MTNECTAHVVNDSKCCNDRQHSYDVTVKVADVWIMPNINEATTLIIPKCNNIIPGTWLWNSQVGFLEVVKYNPTSGQTVVKNTCHSKNAQPGTVFPSCMDFVVNAPLDLDTISDNVTCLAADFISPIDGESALMKVKSTANLRPDYIIAVDTYQYRVLQVIDNTTVKVENFGLGKEGTIELNCDSSCVPVRAINSEAPCLQDPVNEANGIVVCSGGASTVLVGNEEGQIAHWENGEGKWTLINSNIEADCSSTTINIELIAGNKGPYIFNVKDATIFKVGDRLTVGENKDSFVVTEIVSATQFRATANETPEATVILAGTRVCIVDCCDWIPEIIDTILVRLDDLNNDVADIHVNLNEINTYITELFNSKEDRIERFDLKVEDDQEILTLSEDGVATLLNHDVTLQLNPDLSLYDNSNKHFVTTGNSLGTGSNIYASATDAASGDRTLNFKSITSTNDNLIISDDGNTISLTAIDQGGGGGGGTPTTLTNVGGGVQVYKSTTNNVASLRTIVCGPKLSVSQGETLLTFNTSANRVIVKETSGGNSLNVSSTVWNANNYPSSFSGTNVKLLNQYIDIPADMDLSQGSIQYFATAHLRCGFTMPTVENNAGAYVTPRFRIFAGSTANNANLANVVVEVATSLQGVPVASGIPVHDESCNWPYMPISFTGYIPTTSVDRRLYLSAGSWLEGYKSSTFRIEWQTFNVEWKVIWIQVM